MEFERDTNERKEKHNDAKREMLGLPHKTRGPTACLGVFATTEKSEGVAVITNAAWAGDAHSFLE
jgi:hypothetical protein